VCYPKNFNIFLVRHGSVWMGQSTDLGLSALCILAYLQGLVPWGRIPKVVSSSFYVFCLEAKSNRCCQ
jgi:hypothetical protein